MALPPSSQRSRQATPDRHTLRTRAATARRVRHYAEHPELIDRRLQELEREWDVERALQGSAGGLGLLGLILGLVRSRGFLLLPLVAMSFLLQHALQGRCPPLALLRRQGLRSRFEIDCERYALKILRGDFDRVHREGGVAQALRAVDFELPEPALSGAPANAPRQARGH